MSTETDRSAFFRISLIVAAAAALVTSQGLAYAADADAPCPGSLASAAAPATAAGMRVAIDPETGEYTNTPVAGENLVAGTDSSEPFVERPLAGGGFLLETKGRLVHVITATASADGLPTTECSQSSEVPSE